MDIQNVIGWILFLIFGIIFIFIAIASFISIITVNGCGAKIAFLLSFIISGLGVYICLGTIFGIVIMK